MTHRTCPSHVRHVALVCISLRGGGTERIVTRLANYLVQRWQVTLVTLAFSESFYFVDSAVEVQMPPETWRGKSRPVRSMMQIGHAFGALRKSTPDVCLIFGEDIAAPIAMVARLAGVPRSVIFPRGTPSRSLDGAKGRMNALGYRIANRVVVQTVGARVAIAARFPKAAIQTIPNPIEIPADCRPLEERKSWIICVGSIGRQKNQEALLRVFSDLQDAENWQLVFVGDGPDRSRLENMVEEAGLAERVRFLGEQPDVFHWLNQARIFAFTSLSEGFPNALAEALAAGCACISYDCPTGPADLIENEVNGLLVRNEDESAFQAELQRLLTNPELQERLAKEARLRIAAFSADRILGQMEAMIKEVVDSAVQRGDGKCA